MNKYLPWITTETGNSVADPDAKQIATTFVNNLTQHAEISQYSTPSQQLKDDCKDAVKEVDEFNLANMNLGQTIECFKNERDSGVMTKFMTSGRQYVDEIVSTKTPEHISREAYYNGFEYFRGTHETFVPRSGVDRIAKVNEWSPDLSSPSVLSEEQVNSPLEQDIVKAGESIATPEPIFSYEDSRRVVIDEPNGAHREPEIFASPEPISQESADSKKRGREDSDSDNDSGPSKRQCLDNKSPVDFVLEKSTTEMPSFLDYTDEA